MCVCMLPDVLMFIEHVSKVAYNGHLSFLTPLSAFSGMLKAKAEQMELQGKARKHD